MTKRSVAKLATPASDTPKPCGLLWAFAGQALVGPPGPLWAGPLWAPPALVGPLGSYTTDWPWLPPGSDTAHGMTDDVIVTGSGSGSASCTMTPDLRARKGKRIAPWAVMTVVNTNSLK